MTDMLRVGVPTGIGDCLWSLAKVPALLQKEGCQEAHVKVLGGTARDVTGRAFTFLRGFDFVGEVSGLDQSIHASQDYMETDGVIYYGSGKVNTLDLDYRLIANHSLERGVRLERFLPEAETDWDVLSRLQLPADPATSQALSELGDFFCLYLSARRNYDQPNTPSYNYHDSGEYPERWSLDDWVTTAWLLSHYLGRRCRCVVVGASYDLPCALEFGERFRQRYPLSEEPLNLCGRTSMGGLVEVLKRAALVVGYPSGILITATWLRRPTVMFFNGNPISLVGRSGRPPVRLMTTPGFATSWVPPDCIGTTYEFLRFAVHGPEDVLARTDAFNQRGLLERD